MPAKIIKYLDHFYVICENCPVYRKQYISDPILVYGDNKFYCSQCTKEYINKTLVFQADLLKAFYYTKT